MKTAILIDGGHLRACVKAATKTYNNALIQAFAAACSQPPEYLLRVFYYDSPQFEGTVKLPISGNKTTFKANDNWLRELAQLERFAVRRGTIGFRGWRPRGSIPNNRPVTDQDFAPAFEQKGVDMRIGLDIASFSERRTVDRIVLVSADTDMIPAMKHARKAGLEVAIVQIDGGNHSLHDNLVAHADLLRKVALP